MREDRIWLRSQIKSNSQDTLALFKGLSKMPSKFTYNKRYEIVANKTKKVCQSYQIKGKAIAIDQIQIEYEFNA